MTLRRSLAYAIGSLLMLVAQAPAFGVEGVVKRVDREQRRLVIVAGGRDHTIQAPASVKVLDAAGRELPEGFKAKDLREGAGVTLIVDRQGDKLILQAIRFTGRQELPSGRSPAAKQTTDPATKAPQTRPSEASSSTAVLGEEWESLPDGSLGQVTAFQGVGGVAIPAYIRKPASPGPFPVVVLLHGGNDSLEVTYGMGRSARPPTADFVAAGWAVYAVDFRPRAAMPANVGKGARLIQEDTIAAIAKARAFPFVDPKRVAILGGSRGGAIMMRLASKVDVACGVLCSPAGIDLIEVGKVIQRGEEEVNPALKNMVKALEKRSGAAIEEIEKDPAKYKYSSAMTEAPKVRFPLLMINGRNDSASPISVMEGYVRKLREADKEVETYFPDDAPHGFYFGFPKEIPETKEAAQRAVTFLRKHFKGRLGAAAPAASVPAQKSVKKITAWVDPVWDTPAGTTYQILHSKTIHGDWSYLLYLPPDYETSPTRRYPVIYWLHGGGGNQRGGGAFIEFLDSAIRRGRAPAAIVVLLNGLGESCWADSKDGTLPVETVFINELIPCIDANYRTIARREARAVEGMSMGGFGTLRLGFRRNDVFGVVSAIAPALLSETDQPMKIPPVAFERAMGGDLAYFREHTAWTAAERFAREVRNRSRIRIVVGDQDSWVYARCQAYHELLNGRKIAHEFVVVPGVKHNYAGLYRALGDEAFVFYQNVFGSLTATPVWGAGFDNAPDIRGSGGKPAEDKTQQRRDYVKEHPPRESVGLIPLTDLGKGLYQGEPGGLYPGGENYPPSVHQKAGIKIARKIVPRDQEGRSSPDGKIVLLSLGFSNPTMEFQTFQKRAAADPDLNPSLVIVDGCQGGQATFIIENRHSNYWRVVDERLAAKRVTPEQVQAIWTKGAYSGPSDPFPIESKKLQAYLMGSLWTANARFPNLKIAYVSSRTYAGFAESGISPEPFAYETGFSVKWLIADQIAGKPELNYDPANGPVCCPWLAWGPYLWTDGVKGRADGLLFTRVDLAEDGVHPSLSGREKVSTLLMDFLKIDPTARPWFLKKE
ncbi:MAG TPA: alpha/beta fold hydrolase [Sedimentisphaerales bacterium]|nr:alpha/beta fold hydrolase [Sedimentisphaerales bacterium]